MGTISTTIILGFILISILDSDRLMRKSEKRRNESYLEALMHNYYQNH